MKLYFKKLHEDAKNPQYAHDNDSGFDLYALEDAYLYPGAVTPVRTGISVRIPDPFWITAAAPYDTVKVTPEIQVRPKSGLALLKGVTVVNTPGTIDNGYTGELICIMTAVRNVPWYHKLHVAVVRLLHTLGFAQVDKKDLDAWSAMKLGYFAAKGSKIAQGVINLALTSPYIFIQETVENKETSRGAGGFGSTGLQ